MERATAIILAGQRAGTVNPVAKMMGVSHKCLAPICGRPLIEYVVRAVSAHPRVRRIVVSVEEEMAAPVRAAAELALAPGFVDLRIVPAKTTLTDSVYAAAEQAGEGPILITTADNVLIDEKVIDEAFAALGDADVVVSLARREDVNAAHPEGQNKFYELRDHGYANCNLYLMKDRSVLAAAEVYREGGQFLRNPGRVMRAFGLVNLIRLRFRLIGLAGAMRSVSRRLGLKLRASVVSDGAYAVDVDNERTYRVCEELLARRRADA